MGTTIKDYGSSESFISYHTYRKKASYSVNFSQLLAKNAFRYSIPELDEVRKQEHAENNSTNLYLTGKWILNKQHEISADYWFQDQSRNIPPTIVQTISTQSQDDKLHRVGVTQNYFKSHHSIRSRIGFTQQSIFFEDAQISYQNTGEFRTLYLESIAKFNQEQSLQYGIGYQGDINSADNGGFDTSQNLSTHKLLITTTYQKASSNQSPLSHLTLRFVYLNLTQRSNQAISGLLSHQLTLNASTQLKLSARRLWRAPAMNDLFWERGGNPNLLPEQGWEGNVGLFIRKGKALTFAGHLFTRWVENYILWAPEELGSPFMASNVSQVWARGIDLETNWKIVRDQYQVTINSKQSLIYSTPDRSNANIGLEKNKQLIYIPIGKSNLTANLQYRKSWVTVDLQHTRGYHGINDDLDPYTLVNVSLGKQLLIKSVRSNREHQFNIELRGVNLFDQAYSVIERRPMPGRYAELNFTYICPKLTP